MKDEPEIQRTDFQMSPKQRRHREFAFLNKGLAISTFWYNNIQRSLVPFGFDLFMFLHYK